MIEISTSQSEQTEWNAPVVRRITHAHWRFALREIGKMNAPIRARDSLLRTTDSL
jgi:hypothetical protein